MTDAFRDYQRRMRANADALADGLIEGGHDVLTGGTDTHLVQLDLRDTEWTGLAAQERLEECKLTANRNTVPFDERPPMVASGVRLGTPAATMRGFDEDDFREVASIIVDCARTTTPTSTRCATAPVALCDKRPLYPGFRGYTEYARSRPAAAACARAVSTSGTSTSSGARAAGRSRCTPSTTASRRGARSLDVERARLVARTTPRENSSKTVRSMRVAVGCVRHDDLDAARSMRSRRNGSSIVVLRAEQRDALDDRRGQRAVASPMWIVGIDRSATIVSQTLCSVLQPRMKTSAPAASTACASAASSSPASSQRPACISWVDLADVDAEERRSGRRGCRPRARSRAC